MSSNSRELLRGWRRTACEVLNLSPQFASAAQAAPAALGAAILRLAPPSPLFSSSWVSSSTANKTQGSVRSSIPTL